MNRNGTTARFSCQLAMVFVAVTFLLLVGGPPGAVVQAQPPRDLQASGFHEGHLLVASPKMRDPRFRRTVILLVKHDEKGAFGLVLNRTMGSVDISRMLPRSEPKQKKSIEVDLHYGGPVKARIGFVLYSGDTKYPESIEVTKKLAVSSHISLLRAIAQGEGPEKIMVALGYAGWEAGQLESELKQGAWYTAPASDDILFGGKEETKWKRAMERRFRTL